MRGQDVAERRAADALMRQVGGASVRLEIPAPPVAGDDAEQLGLRSPEFQVRLLAPVAMRRTETATEVLVAADVLEELLDVRGDGAIAAAMATVFAVVIGDVRYRTVRTESMRSSLYRLVLHAQGTEVV